jgi:hypothetical protein
VQVPQLLNPRLLLDEHCMAQDCEGTIAQARADVRYQWRSTARELGGTWARSAIMVHVAWLVLAGTPEAGSGLECAAGTSCAACGLLGCLMCSIAVRGHKAGTLLPWRQRQQIGTRRGAAQHCRHGSGRGRSPLGSRSPAMQRCGRGGTWVPGLKRAGCQSVTSSESCKTQPGAASELKL